MLSYFGAELSTEEIGNGSRKITLVGQPELTGRKIIVPGDISSAAFLIVGALITPGSNLKIKNLNTTGSFAPRIGQTFSASGVSGVKYKVIGTEAVATDPVSTLLGGTFIAAVSDIITMVPNPDTSIAAHGLVNDDTVVLTTTGTLPAGLALATTYYVLATPAVNTLTSFLEFVIDACVAFCAS